MRPRVTKRDRKLHLSYDLPHRINTADIYPIPAPNGSSVIIYGHDRGLRVLWRGGRRRKEHNSATTNGTRHEAPNLIDDGDDRPQQEDEYESEEDEVDSDCPYQNIIQELDIDTGSSVLQVAIPNIQASSLTPAVLRHTAVVAIATADNAVRLLQIPLAPPVDEQIAEVLDEVVRTGLELSTAALTTTGLALKYVSNDHLPPTAVQTRTENTAGQLLIAAASRSLRIWTCPVTAEAIVGDDALGLRRIPLQTAIAGLSFHPSTRSTQLLVADYTGAARIYDPYAVNTPARRPASSDSMMNTAISGEPGNWVTTFHTSFHSSGDQEKAPHVIRRKKLLDAKWILSGRGILALLEDGQWGVWDVHSLSKPSKAVEGFAVEGSLGSTNASEPVEPTKPRKGLSKLAPMTPNTRKTKAEELFKGVSKVHGAANLGGISVSSIATRTGQADESVVMWYNSDIYSITSMQSFWQRSTSNSGGFGTLYSPGLSHITDIDLINENINAVAQFTLKQEASTTGQMNTQRDLLVAAEHRMVVSQSLRAPSTGRSLFQLADRPASGRDVQMANAGDSELDRINAALDTMSYGNVATKSVGFAH